MIIFDHLLVQLDLGLLRHHWAKLDYRVPLFPGAPWPITAFMALVWIGVMTLRVVVFALVLALLLISGVLQWRVRSNDPASTLVNADPRTVLVLRPFGGDGRLVLTPNVLNVSDALVPRTVLIESVIGRTIRKAGSRPIAILDQRRIVVPRGVDYRPAGEDWFEIVRALARQAHTVIVIAPPDESVRAGLEQELRMLLEDGHEAKTVLVAPPGGDVGSHAVVGHAARQLGWSPPPQSPLVCFRQGNTVRSYGSFHNDVFQTDMCQQALTTALGREVPTEKGT